LSCSLRTAVPWSPRRRYSRLVGRTMTHADELEDGEVGAGVLADPNARAGARPTSTEIASAATTRRGLTIDGVRVNPVRRIVLAPWSPSSAARAGCSGVAAVTLRQQAAPRNPHGTGGNPTHENRRRSTVWPRLVSLFETIGGRMSSCPPGTPRTLRTTTPLSHRDRGCHNSRAEQAFRTGGAPSGPSRNLGR
jgi:hypothetical protein